jgi:hypothetical protein
MRSTDDGGSPYGLHGRQWGWTWAGDKVADSRKYGEVRVGVLYCSSSCGSSPSSSGGGSSSSATKRARPRHSLTVRRRELETGARF